MDKHTLNLMMAGLLPWKEDLSFSANYRGVDGLSLFDMALNGNSLPCQNDVAIIVTAWFGHLKWLKAALESYRRSGAYIILAYDNPFYGWVKPSEADGLRMMPRMEHHVLAQSFVMKHISYDSKKRDGWFWSMRHAQGVLRQFPNFKYIYHTNGDCLWEKPEGLRDLIRELGDNDLMAGQGDQSLIHTADVIWQADAFHRAFDLMAEVMRVPVVGSHSPEVMLREAVYSLGLKLGIAPIQPSDQDGGIDPYARYGQDSTFKRLVGFKNIFAEYETAGNECREPEVGQYADLFGDSLYWGGDEKETICKYWATSDRRYLYMWMDRWEDSDYNRLYYPLEAYGAGPLTERQSHEPCYA